MSSPVLVSCEGLSKRFGRNQALDDLTMEVPEGTVCGLLGPNGSGKTTAIRILLGLSRPTAGSSSLLGSHRGSREFTEAIHQTGSLIEGPALYGRATARQNMQIQAAARGLGDGGAEIGELLELVGLSARADTNANSFSLGMKQRLGLAMALIGRPRLVILDEPTNGLDPSGIVEIRELIKRLPELGTSVLVSSHLLAEVQLMCDRATIISKGRLVADGTIAEIIAAAGADGGYRVQVGAEEAADATGILAEVGLEVGDLGGGTLIVNGPVDSGSDINVLLAGSGIYLSELSRDLPDLESVFLSLTDDLGAADDQV